MSQFDLAMIIACLIAAFGLTIAAEKARRGSGRYLCDTCKYNDPLACHKVERPTAAMCTAHTVRAELKSE